MKAAVESATINAIQEIPDYELKIVIRTSGMSYALSQVILAKATQAVQNILNNIIKEEENG
jgi:siroheme synthase (precorrin-2 oxidase/ferrochelatase)